MWFQVSHDLDDEILIIVIHPRVKISPDTPHVRYCPFMLEKSKEPSKLFQELRVQKSVNFDLDFFWKLLKQFLILFARNGKTFIMQPSVVKIHFNRGFKSFLQWLTSVKSLENRKEPNKVISILELIYFKLIDLNYHVFKYSNDITKNSISKDQNDGANQSFK